MSEFTDKLSFIRGVCESWHGWNLEQRKSACRALFWLSDLLLEEVQQRGVPPHREYVAGHLLDLKRRVDEGAVSGALDIDMVRDDMIGCMGAVVDDPLP